MQPPGRLFTYIDSMANLPLEKILDEAQKAYQKRDKRAGARLIDEILQRDVNYAGAWDLLYRLFGGVQPYDEFQRSFVSKYYPDKIPLLIPRMPGEQGGAPGMPPAPEKKLDFLVKLFGGRRNPRPSRPQPGKSRLLRLKRQNQPLQQPAANQRQFHGLQHQQYRPRHRRSLLLSLPPRVCLH